MSATQKLQRPAVEDTAKRRHWLKKTRKTKWSSKKIQCDSGKWITKCRNYYFLFFFSSWTRGERTTAYSLFLTSAPQPPYKHLIRLDIFLFLIDYMRSLLHVVHTISFFALGATPSSQRHDQIQIWLKFTFAIFNDRKLGTIYLTRWKYVWNESETHSTAAVLFPFHHFIVSSMLEFSRFRHCQAHI